MPEAETRRKALLLRVGIDKGTGGTLGPIFPDGTFQYVPIPEDRPAPPCPTYAELQASGGGSLARLLPPRLAHRRPHIDPDFETATYGDAAARKRAQLARLQAGDLLVFYSGLMPDPPDDGPRLHAIGYLAVKQVHRLSAADMRRDRTLRRRFGTTAHFRRRPLDAALTLVEGWRGRSRRLDRAMPLGDARQCLLGDLAAFGYRGSLLRAVGHWLRDDTALRALEAWLATGPASLVDDTTRLVRVGPAAIRPARGRHRGDLTIEAAGLRPGDWVVAAPPTQPGRIATLARVNRLAEGPPHWGSASLFWHFAAGAPAMADRSAAPLPRCDGTAIVDRQAIGRVVAWMTGCYRVGFHGGAGAVVSAAQYGHSGRVRLPVDGDRQRADMLNPAVSRSRHSGGPR